MSSLTPQKRLDKNGKLVTRHVRVSGLSKGTDFPAPMQQPQMSREANLKVLRSKIENTVKGLNANTFESYFELDSDSLIKSLTPWSDKALERWRTLMDSDSTLDYAEFLTGLLAFPTPPTETDSYYTLLASSMVDERMFETWDSSLQCSPGVMESSEIYRNFVQTKKYHKVEMPDDILSEENAEQAERIMAHMKVTQHVKDGVFNDHHFPVDDLTRADESNCSYLTNKILMQSVLDHPDKVDQIIAYIDEAGTASIENIEEMLNSPSAALGSGAL